MNAMILRAKVKPESVVEVEEAVRTLFAAIQDAQPEGVHYGSFRLSDGETFVVLLALDGTENPLVEVPGFVEFQQNLKGWLAQPPIPEQATVIGSYNLF